MASEGMPVLAQWPMLCSESRTSRQMGHSSRLPSSSRTGSRLVVAHSLLNSSQDRTRGELSRTAVLPSKYSRPRGKSCEKSMLILLLVSQLQIRWGRDVLTEAMRCVLADCKALVSTMFDEEENKTKRSGIVSLMPEHKCTDPNLARGGYGRFAIVTRAPCGTVPSIHSLDPESSGRTLMVQHYQPRGRPHAGTSGYSVYMGK